MNEYEKFKAMYKIKSLADLEAQYRDELRNRISDGRKMDSLRQLIKLVKKYHEEGYRDE